MLIPHTDFPVRPVRNPGESLVGYIYRFYWENGHEVPPALLSALRELYLDDPDDVFKRIKTVIGFSDTPELDWWVTRHIDISFFGGYRPKWQVFHYNPVRYCPLCLKKLEFHAELWTLPLVEACPFHSCVLLSRCSSCDQSLPWSALRPGWHCRCGAALVAESSCQAPPWTVRLATVIVRADDVGKLSSYNSELTALVSVDEGYSIQQVYDFMGWANTLRRQLTRRSINGSGPRWAVRRNPAAHASPGGWEERLLFTGIATRERILRRLLKWNFKRQQAILVSLRNEGPLALAMKALDGLPRNPLTEGLHSQAERLLNELHAGIEDRSDVYFHPSLYKIDRQPYHAALAQWWCALANQVSVLEPENQLSWRWSSSSFYGVNRSELVVHILNVLLDAACRGKDVKEYTKLTKRWHIPEELQRKLDPSEVLSALAKYLGGLQSSELAFVLDLLDEVEGVGHANDF